MLELEEVFIPFGPSRDRERPSLVVGTAWAKALRHTCKDAKSQEFGLAEAAAAAARVPAGNGS